ncbi:MAG: hypothetical protein MRJ96_02535 [Nitrospirales bacterium]|nr:hypothetical protein [Nitrospira sp.]MDR4500318.1 hypothetical protein [Nitrospirales bacterium]
MPTQTDVAQKSTIFKKSRKKGFEQWFVRVTCNVLGSRIYGPFPAELEAERFREGAEFELRKLLDFELPILSGSAYSTVHAKR